MGTDTKGSEQRPTKKQKRRSALDVDTNCDASADSLSVDFSRLDGLAYDTVVSFLNVRDLLHLTLCCHKAFLRNHNPLTHQHVVRSSILSGGPAKHTTRRLCELLPQKTIIVPSPFQWLRLAVVGGRITDLDDRYLNHDHPHDHPHDRYDQDQDRPDPQDPHQCTTIDPHASKMDSILRCYRKWSRYHEHSQHSRERREKQWSAKVSSTRVLVQHLRNALLMKLADIFENNEHGWPFEWNDIILDCHYYHADPPASTTRDNNEANGLACAFFKCPLVNSRMKPYLMEPNRGNRKNMECVASALATEMRRLFSTGFHDFSFLSDCSMKEPMEAALRAHFQTNYSITTILHSSRMDDRLMDLLLPCHMIECLLYLGRGYDTGNNLSFLDETYGGFDTSFADAILKSTSMPTIDEQFMSLVNTQDLARTIWSACAEQGQLFNDLASATTHAKAQYDNLYQDATTGFYSAVALIPLYIEFVERAARELFQQEEDPEEEIQFHVKVCCAHSWRSVDVIEALQRRQFNAAYETAWLGYQAANWH